MKPDFTLMSYGLQARWAQRGETASSVADRYLRYTSSLSTAHDVFASWFVGSRRSSRLEDVRGNLIPFVQKDLEKDGLGVVAPELGFRISGLSRDQRQLFLFSGTVGSPIPMPHLNVLSFNTDLGFLPNPDIISFALWRSICLATITSWEPLYCTAGPSTLGPFRRDHSWYWESWFTYVHPSLVDCIEVPEVPVVEQTPDGGLLLAAANEVFMIDNADHLAAARRIANATSPLDAMMPPI